MLAGQRSRGGKAVHTDLAEAALASGFALLRLAELQRDSNARRQTLQQAEAACAEGRGRLFRIGGDTRRMAVELAELSAAVAEAKARARSGPPPKCRILQMPRRPKME